MLLLWCIAAWLGVDLGLKLGWTKLCLQHPWYWSLFSCPSLSVGSEEVGHGWPLLVRTLIDLGYCKVESFSMTGPSLKSFINWGLPSVKLGRASLLRYENPLAILITCVQPPPVMLVHVQLPSLCTVFWRVALVNMLLPSLISFPLSLPSFLLPTGDKARESSQVHEPLQKHDSKGG